MTLTIGQYERFAHYPRAVTALWLCAAAYVSILPIGGMTALRNLLFFTTLGLGLGLFWKIRERPDIVLPLPWLAFAIPVLLSIPNAADQAYSLGEIKPELLTPFLVFTLAANLVRDEIDFVRLLRVLALANAFLVAYSLTTKAIGGTTVDGLIGTINTGVGYYSTYLVAVAPFLLLLAWQSSSEANRKQAWALVTLLFAGLLSLYFTGNRQGFIALGVETGLAIVLLGRHFSRKDWLVTAVAVALLCSLFLIQYANRTPLAEQGIGLAVQGDSRWSVWKITLERLLENPWTGGGFGLRTFQILYPEMFEYGPFWHAHNTLLNKWVELGLPGLIGFLLLFCAIPLSLLPASRGKGLPRAAAVAAIAMTLGFLAKNMTDDFFYRESGYVFWLLAGATLGLVRGPSEEKELRQ